MNKKKKNTRLKHRKNKARVKKIQLASMLKAKPKKIIASAKVGKNWGERLKGKEQIIVERVHPIVTI